MRARGSGGLAVLLFLAATVLGPHAVASGQQVVDQSAAELIQSDFQAGTLTADQRALFGTWSLMNPALLPEPYRSAPPLQADTTPAGLSFLAGWDDLSAATRSTLSDFLTLNEYRVPLVLVSGATDWPECGETHFVDVGVVFAKAFRCKHNVFDGSGTLRFEVYYNVAGLDDPDLFEIIGGIIGNSAIGYGEPVAASNADGNGVPDAIDTISASLLKSWETYLSDGYRPISTPQDVAVHANASVLPGFGGPYVVQVRHDRQFHYLPRHELFHLFQYQYLEELDFGVDFLDGDSEINWWMEASAEWAAHRVGEAIEDDGGSPAESIDYALALADFLGRPSELIDRWDGFRAPRSYGSFILAGYLDERFGNQFLVDAWEEIDVVGGKPILAMGVELDERDTSWEAVLAGFAAANYWLEGPDAAVPYMDSDFELWRGILADDFRTDGDSERGDLGLYLARPARATWLLTEGAAVTGSTTVEGGRSSYFDLAPPAGGQGILEVEVETDPGTFLSAQLIPFRVYPDSCQEPLPITIEQEADGSWHGTADVVVDNDCYFATLVITNPDPAGSERTVTWQATFEQAPSCTHPRLTGPNILSDGGFEAANGYGPGGNEIPGFSDVGDLTFPFLNYSDDSPTTLPPHNWWQADSASGTATPWTIASGDPRSGTYHARQVLSSETVRNTLYVTAGLVCPELSERYQTWLGNPIGAPLEVWQVGYSAVVVPGDQWELDFWAKASAPVNSGSYRIWVEYADAADTDSFAVGYVLNQALTTSYANFNTSGVIPDADSLGFEPHLLFVRIENNWVTNSGSVTLDIDAVTLSVTP